MTQHSTVSRFPLVNNRSFHPTLLREYDIRGLVGHTLFEKDAYWIGRCFGHKVREQSGNAVAVGRDGRLSSPHLEDALIQGLCEAGVDVYHVGLGPTPLLYFSEYELPVNGAIMVTGSHNPPSHNGFKMSLGRKPFFGQDIQTFSKMLLEPLCQGKGKVYDTSLFQSYATRVLQGLELNEHLTIAWDPGHGATAEILKVLLKTLPGKHLLLNDTIDGTFPAHPPDPSDPANLVQLQQTVRENKCDLGIAFDGDGDRLVVMDGKSRILWGDQLLHLFAKDLLTRKPGATIIADIKASQGLFDDITRLGGNSVMWKTGHSHIKAKMAGSNVLLAGEMSGHFFFKENYFGFDDGIYAALRLLHLLSHSSQKLAELYESLPFLPSTPELRIPCDAERKPHVIQGIKTRLLEQSYNVIDIDGVRVQSKEGWWLLRESHTQDILVARCEGYTAEGLEKIKTHLREELKRESMVYDIG